MDYEAAVDFLDATGPDWIYGTPLAALVYYCESNRALLQRNPPSMSQQVGLRLHLNSVMIQRALQIAPEHCCID